jgi:hypothetical protein
MHSFQPSRGRILFEVFCALVISASCVGISMQTGAWAMLPAAAVTLLYGLIHAFDMAGHGTAAVEPQRIDFAADLKDSIGVSKEDPVQPAPAEQPPVSDIVIEVTELVEPVAPRANKGRRAKTPRKETVASASSPAKRKKTEPAPPSEEMKAAVPEPQGEVEYHSLAPLFEPEPFVRQRHAVFGRKAG